MAAMTNSMKPRLIWAMFVLGVLLATCHGMSSNSGDTLKESDHENTDRAHVLVKRFVHHDIEDAAKDVGNAIKEPFEKIYQKSKVEVQRIAKEAGISIDFDEALSAVLEFAKDVASQAGCEMICEAKSAVIFKTKVIGRAACGPTCEVVMSELQRDSSNRVISEYKVYLAIGILAMNCIIKIFLTG